MLMRNEWAFTFRQPLIWVCCTIPLVFSWLLSGGLALIDTNILKQYQLNLIVSQMMVMPILVGVISPIIFLRDQQANMHELVWVTPVTIIKRQLVRFFHVFILVSVIGCLSCLIIFLNTLTQLDISDRMLAYSIEKIMMFILPNSFFLCVLSFVVCLKSTTSLANYVVFSLLFVGYLFLASITGNPVLSGSSMASEMFYQFFLWCDPFGFTAAIDQLGAEAAKANIPLLTNRIAVVFLSIWLLYIALNQQAKRSTPLRRANNKQQNQLMQQAKSNAAVVSEIPQSYQELRHNFSHSDQFFTPWLSLFRTSSTHLLSNKITIAIILIWPILIFNTVASSSGYAEAFATMEYHSVDAINHFAFDMLPLFGTLLMLLWSWQLCSIKKRVNMAELIATTPVKNSHLLSVELAIISIMVFLFIVLSFIGASVGQWFTGSNYQIIAYFKALGLVGLPLLLIAWLFICIFHLSRSEKIAGVMIAAILLCKFTPITSFFNLTHTFWNIAWAPIQAPDLVWGYRNSITSYWPYMCTWIVIVMSVCCITNVFSYRGTDIARAKMTKKSVWLLIPLVTSAAMLLLLDAKLVAEKPLTNSDKRETFKAQYEKKFAHWQDKLQPVITHIDAQIDFFTAQQKANFVLTYTLINQSKQPIKEILVGRSGSYQWADTEVEGATKIHFDNKLNQAIFTFDQTMLPGETRTLTTHFTYHQPRLWPIRGHQFVSPEMSYIRSIPLIPTVGYQQIIELRDAQLRQHHQLKQKQNMLPSQVFADENTRLGQYQWLTMTSTITTDPGQYALTQGQLMSRQVIAKRQIFKYQTTQPMRALPSWLSIPHQPNTIEHEGVTLQVFASNKEDQQRAKAIQLHLAAMADTLTWFNIHISPYKAKQLNVVSMPSVIESGYALPQVILINDELGFRAKPSTDTGIDQRYRRAVHETAHQWFGHDIGNGIFQDRSFLVESMAKYVELVMLERHVGQAAVKALVELEKTRHQHQSRRQLSKNLALVDATESHDQYSRATIIFNELREQLGDVIITDALRTVWQKHRYPNSPANAMDFVRALRKQTNVKHHALIERLLLKPQSY